MAQTAGVVLAKSSENKRTGKLMLSFVPLLISTPYATPDVFVLPGQRRGRGCIEKSGWRKARSWRQKVEIEFEQSKDLRDVALAGYP